MMLLILIQNEPTDLQSAIGIVQLNGLMRCIPVDKKFGLIMIVNLRI